MIDKEIFQGLFMLAATIFILIAVPMGTLRMFDNWEEEKKKKGAFDNMLDYLLDKTPDYRRQFMQLVLSRLEDNDCYR